MLYLNFLRDRKYVTAFNESNCEKYVIELSLKRGASQTYREDNCSLCIRYAFIISEILHLVNGSECVSLLCCESMTIGWWIHTNSYYSRMVVEKENLVTI